MKNATFTITSSDQPTGSITVSYNVSETGNFITDGDQTVDLMDYWHNNSNYRSDF